MNGPEHYKEAQRCLVRAADEHNATADYYVARAQAHATLALTAATVDVGMTYDSAVRNEAQWREVTRP